VAGDRVPDNDVWDRMCKLYGWPQAFVGSARGWSHDARRIVELLGEPAARFARFDKGIPSGRKV
jgi:hypothetical protein